MLNTGELWLMLVHWSTGVALCAALTLHACACVKISRVAVAPCWIGMGLEASKGGQPSGAE